MAGRNLHNLTPVIPRFLPWPLRAAIRAGAAMGPVAPWLVVPLARRSFRRMVRHLIIDATDVRLGSSIRRIQHRHGRVRLNVNLLGESVLGAEEAARRLERTRRLLERDDVDYVSIKVSSTVSPHSPWALDAAVEDAINALTPFFEVAAADIAGSKFINLDMEEYRDLDLTLAVFTGILEKDEFLGVEAGVAIQSYLPDALGAMAQPAGVGAGAEGTWGRADQGARRQRCEPAT